MDFGVSSACFYPLETEKSLKIIGEMGIQKAEIFFNSPSELSGDIFSEILKIKDYYGIDVVSVHPWMSSSESVFLFSEYERRFYDILEHYKKIFEACAALDTRILVMHGMKKDRQIRKEEYYKRFSKLSSLGKTYGVKVSQENVDTFVSGDTSYLKDMKKFLKEDFHLVFDVKQMRRCGYVEDDFFDEFSSDIVNVHISDSKDGKDCLAPGEGDYDLKGMLKKLDGFGYDGCCLIELYRDNYSDYSQIKRSYNYLCSLVK